MYVWRERGVRITHSGSEEGLRSTTSATGKECVCVAFSTYCSSRSEGREYKNEEMRGGEMHKIYIYVYMYIITII